jgi:hypothetical protein
MFQGTAIILANKMEITGIDYVLYSDAKPQSVKKKILKRISSIWESPIIDDSSTDDCLDLFVERDLEMQETDNGYALDHRGEGPFWLLGSRINNLDFDIIVQKIKYEGQKSGSPEPYTSKLLFRYIYSYTVVLPGYIEESNFCLRVYNMLLETLKP